MHDPPLQVVAGWPPPNFVDPETRGPALVITNVILIVLVLIAVALRYYARAKITRSFGIDDIFIGVAVVWGFSDCWFAGLRQQSYRADRYLPLVFLSS